MVEHAAANEAADKKTDDDDASALWAEMQGEDQKSEKARQDAEAEAKGHETDDDQDQKPAIAADMGTWRVEGEGAESDEDGDRAATGDDGAGEGKKAAEPSAKSVQDADFWAGATEAQRKAWQEAQDRLNAAEQYRRSQEGRLAAFQRQVAELKQLQQAAADPKAAAKDKQEAAAEVETATQKLVDDFLDGDEFKPVREDFPEIDAAFRAFSQNINKALEAKLKPFQQLRQSVETDRQAQQQQAFVEHANAEAAALSAAVPGWAEAINADLGAWRDWIGQQPRHIQEAFQRNEQTITDHREAADVIGRYMRETGKQSAPATAGNRNTGSADKRRRQLEGAASVSSKLPAARPGIPEEGDPQQMWEAFKQRGL